jgi:hypothetical protein
MVVINLIDSNGKPTQLWNNIQCECIKNIRKGESFYLVFEQLVSDHGGNFYGATHFGKYIRFNDDEKASFFVLKFS